MYVNQFKKVTVATVMSVALSTILLTGNESVVIPGKLKHNTINPQPEPPGKIKHKTINPQPEPPGKIKQKMINPQPEPPGKRRTIKI
jgi:hypothetical protein